MDLESKKFGSGPKELGGAVDLIKQFKLWPHHEFFCKRSLPLSITETNYVRNFVGDKEIRKGKGMELVQLFQNASGLRLGDLQICPFDLGLLGEAFRIREIAHIDLPLVEIGIPTMVSKSRAESKDKKRKCIKQEDRGKEKEKYRKLKHHCKDINGDKNGRKIIHYDSGLEHLKKPQDMKRRYAGSGDPFNVHGQQNGRESHVFCPLPERIFESFALYEASRYLLYYTLIGLVTVFFGYVIPRTLERLRWQPKDCWLKTCLLSFPRYCILLLKFGGTES